MIIAGNTCSKLASLHSSCFSCRFEGDWEKAGLVGLGMCDVLRRDGGAVYRGLCELEREKWDGIEGMGGDELQSAVEGTKMFAIAKGYPGDGGAGLEKAKGVGWERGVKATMEVLVMERMREGGGSGEGGGDGGAMMMIDSQ